MKMSSKSLAIALLCSSSLFAIEQNFDRWIEELSNHRSVRSRAISSIVQNVDALSKKNRSVLNLKGLIAHTNDANAINRQQMNEGKVLSFLDEVSIPGKGAFLESRVSKDVNTFLSYSSAAVGDTVVVTLVGESGDFSTVNLRVKWGGSVYKSHKSHFNMRNDKTMSSIQKIVIPILKAGDFDILVSDKGNENEVAYSLFVSGAEYAETEKERASRTAYIRSYCDERSARAAAYAEEHNLPLTEHLPDGSMRTLIDVVDGEPQYYSTFNMDANVSTATTKVWPGGSLGLSLTGENFGRSIGIWDGGAVLTSHQEFGGRVTLGDNVATHDHATHVAGTMVASGVKEDAKGAAYEARLISYDWNNDLSEMNSEAGKGLLVSQHSYGFKGNYNYSRNWDVMANNNPYYLPSKSAANEGPGYNTVTLHGNAKNILTVGSCNDLPNGWTIPSAVKVSSFSSRGPAPDGRIKPDILGNGYQVYSTVDASSTSYGTKSGTSMAGPNVAGSISLLQQHYFETHNEAYMLSHTLKNVVLHTANDAGTTGPDYASGWGVLNMEGAVGLITKDEAGKAGLIQELSLSSGAEDVHDYTADGEAVKVTICWNDPAPSSNTGNALVNDLDLRILMNGTEYEPWVLSKNSPSAGATTGDNKLDNVEQVYIKNPSGNKFTIKVSHKGTLQGSSQKYALCVSGGSLNVDPYVEVSAPNGGERFIMGDQYDLTWSDNLDEKVTIDLYKGNEKVKTIVASTESDGQYTWTVPEDLEAGTNYLIKMSGTSVEDVSDDFFEIVAKPELTLISPNGGESFQPGETMKIKWEDNLSGNIDIRLNSGAGLDSMSSNLVLYKGWSAEVDALGSSVDSGAAIVENDEVSVTIKQVAMSGTEYPWAQLSVYTGDNFRDVDSIEIEYKASKTVLLTLPQEPLSASGESYFTSLTSATSWKTVVLPVNETTFKKPEWSTSTEKLDLTKIASLSFSGDFDSQYGGSVDIQIKNIVLHGYAETPTINVATNETSDGEFEWEIPDTIPADSTYIITLVSKDFEGFSDVSDATFSIGIGEEAVIDIDGEEAARISGFQVGPNPVSYGDEIYFQITPTAGAIVGGDVVVLDVLGNRVYSAVVPAILTNETETIGSWNLRMPGGRMIARGSYQAVLVVEVASGEEYRIRRTFVVTD